VPNVNDRPAFLVYAILDARAIATDSPQPSLTSYLEKEGHLLDFFFPSSESL
jgi:hypothetical protein